MIILPFPPRRALLRSFCLIMSLIVALFTGSLLAIWTSSKWHILSLIIFVLLALFGLIWKRTTLIAYIRWNKLARLYSRFVRQWLMFISFYIVFTIIGRTGTSIRLGSPFDNKSEWVSFSAQTFANSNPNESLIESYTNRSWISSFLIWAKNSGNCWAYCLIPFFLLISALEDNKEKSLTPTNMYTLY